jgi:hypothetical protein
MERQVTVEFGPSRSKRFGKAVVEARNGGECTEAEPGRYRVRFALGADSDAYTGLARLRRRSARANSGSTMASCPAARSVPYLTPSGPSGKARIRLRRWCSRSDSAHTAPLPLGGSSLPTSTPAGRFPTSRHKHGESQPLKNHRTKNASE